MKSVHLKLTTCCSKIYPVVLSFNTHYRILSNPQSQKIPSESIPQSQKFSSKRIPQSQNFQAKNYPKLAHIPVLPKVKYPPPGTINDFKIVNLSLFSYLTAWASCDQSSASVTGSENETWLLQKGCVPNLSKFSNDIPTLYYPKLMILSLSLSDGENTYLVLTHKTTVMFFGLLSSVCCYAVVWLTTSREHFKSDTFPVTSYFCVSMRRM